MSSRRVALAVAAALSACRTPAPPPSAESPTAAADAPTTLQAPGNPAEATATALPSVGTPSGSAGDSSSEPGAALRALGAGSVPPAAGVTPSEAYALLQEPDLAGGTAQRLSVADDPMAWVLGIRVPGNGPARLTDALQRVAVLRDRLGTPTHGLVVFWEGNRRRATRTWDAERGRPSSSAAAYDVRIPDPADYSISLYPRFETIADYGRSAPYDAKCTAMVKNLTDKPITFQLGCKYKQYQGG